MQLSLGAQIDLDAQRLLDIDLQSRDVEQRRTRPHLHEEIEVAVIAIRPARRRTEDAQLARAARRRDGENPAAMEGEDFRGTHGRHFRRNRPEGEYRGGENMKKVCDKVLYGDLPAEARSAAGVKGVLIRTAGGAMVFRVHDGPGRFTDYDIRHDELSVTIDVDELAAFYRVGERDILDHSPRVLGLRKIEG